MDRAPELNWAGNYAYRAATIAEPSTVDELQELVARSPHVRALGSRHSFSDIADTEGTLVSLRRLDSEMRIDESDRTVTVGGGVPYAHLAEDLNAQGWALANLASLPHISVAGAIATGTHGSGDRNQSLAAAVTGLEIIGPDGAVRRVRRGDSDFNGSVVALGALGIVTRVTLDIEPTYDVRQVVFTGLPWSTLADNFDRITGSGYSVSLFTDFSDAGVQQVWVKSRDLDSPVDLDLPRAEQTMPPLRGADTAAVTEQGGIVGPWHERLPHFRAAFTPSRGEELQTEYLLPRPTALDAIDEMRGLSEQLAPLLQVSEIRTVAADDCWLSPAYDRDVVALHFTWIRDQPAVDVLLPAIEQRLLPLGALPHWGKCFTATAADLAPLYPRWDAFRSLRDRVDPTRKFNNAFLDRTLDSRG